MKPVYQVKGNDCCVCAYAMAEGIEWHQAKRRLKNVLVNRKTLGVSTALVRRLGINGYTPAPNGPFKTFNRLFNYGTGIIFIDFGNGSGHALFWDGCKFICHDKNGRFNGSKDLSEMVPGESICLALIKKRRKLTTIIKSYLSMIINNLRANVKRRAT